MQIKDLYEQRKRDITLTIDFKEPQRVPVAIEVLTWPVAYADCKTEDLLDKPNYMAEQYLKVFDRLYVDCLGYPAGIPMPYKAIKALGSDGYIMSDDGVTIQHVQNCAMQADEYEKLINDPRDFIINVLSKRKFKKLNGSDEDVYNAMKESIRLMKLQNEGNGLIAKTLEDKYGIVSIRCGGGQMAPFDSIFDEIRGFKETLGDMRRHSNELKHALDAVYEFYKPANTEEIVKRNKPVPMAGHGIHATPFISKKQFEEFWWPHDKKNIQRVVDAGGKYFIKGEGNMNYLFEYYKEFPKGTFVIQLGEQDNPYEANKRIGDWATLCTSISINDMKYLSKSECIDNAKKLIDKLAPGGGFIWMNNTPLLCADDVNPDNLFAVYDFVKEYGKY